MKYEKMVSQAIGDLRINPDSITPEMISGIFRTQSNNFDSTFAEQFINNFYSLSVEKIYSEMTQSEKVSITQQITDHVDVTGLSELNKSKFFNHPLILESLTM